MREILPSVPVTSLREVETNFVLHAGANIKKIRGGCRDSLSISIGHTPAETSHIPIQTPL